jgi:hypothetical protein
MSRLIDLLNSVSKAMPLPMGFRTTQAALAQPRILLIASLPDLDSAESLAKYTDGADAVLFRLAKSSMSATALKKIVASLPDIPWGKWLENTYNKKKETPVNGGCDFAVFSSSSPLSYKPQDNNIGKILQVESALGDGLLRAINDLPVDAVLNTDVCEAGDSLTWHHLAQLQRLANLLAKPLLASVPLNVTAGELKELWEAGIEGAVVEVGGEQPAGKMKSLRQAIDEVKFPPSRRRGKTEALLPQMGKENSRVTEDEEEE